MVWVRVDVVFDLVDNVCVDIGIRIDGNVGFIIVVSVSNVVSADDIVVF